jgi:hypothetical protein
MRGTVCTLPVNSNIFPLIFAETVSTYPQQLAESHEGIYTVHPWKYIIADLRKMAERQNHACVQVRTLMKKYIHIISSSTNSSL